jgi:hypothetical protein
MPLDSNMLPAGNNKWACEEKMKGGFFFLGRA